MATPIARLKLGLAALAAVLAGLLVAQPALADILFSPTQMSLQGSEENILITTQQNNVQTVAGVTNQSNVPFAFTSLTTQNLNGSASGQAVITCATNCVGPNSDALNSIDINVAPGYAFTNFIGNPENGSGTATVTAIDNFGVSFTYQLSQGQNFFTLYAAPGSNEFIREVQVQMMTGGYFSDFKQPRVSGLCVLNTAGCQDIPVPEPASLALLGSALAGLGLFGRRRRRA